VSDPAEQFIQAAVRPLADNAELQMMAAQELQAVIKNAPESASAIPLDHATEKLENARPKEPWKVILYAAALIAALLAAIPVTRDLLRIRLASWTIFSGFDTPFIGFPGPRPGPDAIRRAPDLFGPLTSSDRLLLFGDLSQPTKEAAMRRLWESAPEDPALFADYARVTPLKSGLPVDFLKTADRLAPENAWFRYFAASVAAYKSVESTKVPYHLLKQTPQAPRCRILNPAAHAEAIRLFEEASRLPSSDSYYESLLLRRLDILPPGDDTIGRDLAEAYLELVVPSRSSLGRNVSLAISARAEELAAAGDREGLQALVNAWEIFALRSIEDPGLRPLSWEPASYFARAARNLGMDSLAERYARLAEAIWKRERASNLRSEQLSGQWGDLEHAADGIIMVGTKVEHPPPIQRSDIKPGILAKQSAWRKYAAAAGGLFMLVLLALAAVVRFSRGLQVRSLSASLVKVLDPSDYRWIILGGVILPVLLHVLAEWLANVALVLPVRDLGPATILRFAALAAALVTLPALLVSNRLGLLLGRLGWKKPRAAEVPVSAILIATAAAAGFTQSEVATVIGWTIALVHLVVVTLSVFFSVAACVRSEAVASSTWARGLLPAYATGLLLFAILVPFHHAREKHWTNLNVLTKIERGVPAANRYLHEIEQIERKELLELLNGKP
jgi:hypothetical protein